MTEAHARLGPSNTRWPNCPGSVREESKYPDIPSAAAIDGTGSHLLLELCLKNNVPASQYDSQIIGVNHEDQPNGWMVHPDRCARVQMALDYITRRVAELKQQFPGCIVNVTAESKTHPGQGYGRTDWWGTVDITIVARCPMSLEVYFIEVADYKDGRMYVSEKKNSQLTSYLFGQMLPHILYSDRVVGDWVFASERIRGCRKTIIQPKTNPVIRYECSTIPDHMSNPASVVNDANDLAWAASLTDDDDAPLIPGKWCLWCKANPKRGGNCTAAVDQSLETVNKMTSENGVPGTGLVLAELQQAVADPASLTADQLSEIADVEPGLQTIFDVIKGEIEKRIEQGISVPGYAMEPGKGSNVWNKDDDEIEKKLKARRLKKDDIFPAKLITPAAFMSLDKLTPDQKERFKAEHISFVASKKKVLKRVARTEQDKSTENMFAGVDADAPSWVIDATISDQPEPSTEVSFF